MAEKEWCTWDEWQIVTLISVYSSADIQAQLNLSKHNSRVFELIAERMKSYDIDRTPQQCRNKIKKLKCEYRKVDTDPSYRKAFNYYDQMSPFMKRSKLHMDFESRSMLDIVSSFPGDILKKIKEEPNVSDDSRNYVEVELEEGSDSGTEDARLQAEEFRHLWSKKSSGEKRPLEEAEEEEEDEEDPAGETSMDSCSDPEQTTAAAAAAFSQASNGSRKRARVTGSSNQQLQEQPVLETLMETFLESMRQERRSMRQELAKFEERRIQFENEAELRKLQMEHQHELKMATLLGQITTKIIDSLAKKE